MKSNIITIPSQITKGEELIIIPRSLYERLSECEKIKDISFKTKIMKEKKTIDEIIALGEKELKENKTIIAESSRKALKILYEKSK